MARTLKSDKALFWAAMLLVATSLVMVFSASFVPALEKTGDATSILKRQAAFVVIGLVALLVAVRVDYHHYRRPVVIWTCLAVVIILLVAALFGPERNNTNRWLIFGGFSLQPSEFAKLAVILFVAALLERRMDRVNEWAAMVPIVVVLGIIALLILKQPDFGSTAVICLIVLTMVFTAGLHYKYLTVAAAVLVPLAGVVISLNPYQANRLLIFMDPESDAQGLGFQVLQALTAVGSGGLFGRGLLEGIQKLYYIPEPYNDFIFAIIGEELGLLGTTAMVCLYMIIAWRGLRTALMASDRFGAFLAIGLTTMIAWQALVNISVVLSLVPTKGIPLPLVSNGGSSLVANLLAVGVLLAISQHGAAAAPAAVAKLQQAQQTVPA